ncbi:MAG: threonine aldolase [Actinobacteria bacterium]|nr:threonine aldolase [Actinomycetota bacterium]
MEAIAAACRAFVPAHEPEWRAPRSALARLSERASEGTSYDRYGDGEVVQRLEQRVAGLLGKEAAVFLPTGTMAQQIALRIWADRAGLGTVAFHPRCHLERHEEKGYQELHGLRGRLVGDADRLLSRDDLEGIAEPVAALLLELPQRELGGRLPEWDELVAQAGWAREHEVALHLDGARLWLCPPYYGRGLDEIAALFDTVYVSLYKDLGAPGGCLLAGPADVIDEARVWQIRHGGRIFSVYPYALAAERGLDEVLPRMDDFLARARELGAALAQLEHVVVVPQPPQTPFMHLYLSRDGERLREAALDIAEERGVWLGRHFAVTPLPTVHLLELPVGASTLELPVEEVVALFGELLERSA